MPSQQQPAKILSEENRLYLMVKDFSQLLRNEWLTEKHINPLSTNGISFDPTITGPLHISYNTYSGPIRKVLVSIRSKYFLPLSELVDSIERDDHFIEEESSRDEEL